MFTDLHQGLLQVLPENTDTNSQSYLPTPPLGQDMTQGQFLSRV